MKLINLDSLILLGPGSEWFWSALSGVVLAVTLLAVYRQVRLQRAAGARVIELPVGNASARPTTDKPEQAIYAGRASGRLLVPSLESQWWAPLVYRRCSVPRST